MLYRLLRFSHLKNYNIPWSLSASICKVVHTFSISSCGRFFISLTSHASFRIFLRVTGHIPGISSRIFFFILFIRADLLAVMENLWDSSRAFWRTISSGVPFSKSIGFFSPGRNISSSLLAMEQMGGICHCEVWPVLRRSSASEDGSNPCSVFSETWIATLHSVRDDGSTDWFWLFQMPSLTHDTAEESCPFPQSMMMRCGKLSCSNPSSVRRSITSRCEAKSSIWPSSSDLILYFLYLDVSGFPFTMTTREA